MTQMTQLDVEKTLSLLTLDEKINLLSGRDNWRTHEVSRLGIPSLMTSDGPHGVRGPSFFNGPKGMLLPASTAMGATFDVRLMRSVGEKLAVEAKEKNCHILLAPTVCVQRSPLIGRGFEAFGEDPWLSGVMASSYITGIQENGIACAIKHFAAHDKSFMSIEDDVRASEKTLRELHLLPFHIAVKNAAPWVVMTAYNKINGIHASENSWLIKHILRNEWQWNGLVMTDWFGMYSTSESLNAGLDLEMPGPTKWRGDLLRWSVASGKVKQRTVDGSVRNLLKLINKVSHCSEEDRDVAETGDSQSKRTLCRKVASDSIVLLKNSRNTLPLDSKFARSYVLIGSAVHNPAVSGGGSADLRPYYIRTPYEAITSIVGIDNVQTSIGCYGHMFTPLLSTNISIPGCAESPGYMLQWYREDPRINPEEKSVASTTTTQAQMYFADNLPNGVAAQYWLQVSTIYTAPKTYTAEMGLCVVGRGLLLVDDEEKIDLFNSQPPKTGPTPMFDQASMEVTTEIQMEKGRQYKIVVYLKNESAVAGAGALNCGGLRIGCCEKLDKDIALEEAVALAKSVDFPIIITGLSSDYESEAADRASLSLPPGIDELIERVAKANPNTIVVTQSGCPIAMPWIDHVSTLLHAWYGGQETGNAIADVLFGFCNPSGRLSITFPKRLEDTPAFLSFGQGQKEIYYGEGVFIGYRYYEKLRNSPLFYFGYGLSYSNFKFSNLCAPQNIDLTVQETFEVSVDVRNTSVYDGQEVIQIYIAGNDGDRLRPLKELKGFTKLWIKSGSLEKARILLDKYAFSRWCEDEHAWIAKRGTFQVMVARSADPRDVILSKDLELSETLIWSGV